MFVIVEVTCADRAEAERIGDLLLAARLAACVHLSPLESRYVWRGERVDDSEVLLRAQTVSSRFDDIVRVVSEAHSYEVPAVTATQLVGGAEPYLAWVAEQVDVTP